VFKIPSYNVFKSLFVAIFLRYFVEGLQCAFNCGSVCTSSGRRVGGGAAAEDDDDDDDNNDNFAYSNK
jgi:hypothetical protein